MDRLPPRRRIYDQFTEDDEPYAGNYPLSKQILDYYYKFGQERNLERYLKLNRSLGSKSSSDGSLDQHSGRRRSVHFAPQPARERSKSMDCLDREKKEEKLVQTESTSYQSCEGSGGEEVEQSSSSEMIVATEEAKEQQRRVTVKRDKEGRKSYQINVESKVEIAFPTQFYQAMTAGMVFPGQQDVVKETPIVVQVVSVPQPQQIEEEKKEIEETPIEVSFNQTLKNQSTISEFQPVSPASSIASNKQRLEWDSLGDVGYQRSQSVDCVPYQHKQKKLSMKVASKSASDPPTMVSSKSTGAIPKRQIMENIPLPPLPQPHPPPPKDTPSPANKSSEKWKQLLKRVKDQSQVIMETSGAGQHLETPSSKILFDADSSKFAQSTPVASPNLQEERGDQDQEEKKNRVKKKTTTREEKSSQTTDIGTVSRSIQAIYEHLDKTTSMSSAHESTAGSFEFIKGSRHVDRACQPSNSTSSSLSTTPASPPTVDDEHSKRMNTMRVKKEISKFLGNVTGKDPNNEVDLHKAVDYIALLFDSKSIDRKFKRKLVEKIISKLLRSKCGSKEQTSVQSDHSGSEAAASAGGESSQCTSRDSTKLSDIKQSDLLKEWLKPMTNSEVEYERKKEERKSLERNPQKSPLAEEEHPQELNKDSSSSSVSQDNQEKEKNLQLKCIEREIEYLERIKKLIQVGRMNLMDDTNKNVLALQQRRGGPQARSESRITAEESLSMVSTRNSLSVASSALSKRSSTSHPHSDWDSHKNLQIVIKDRRKLNTPPDNQPPARHSDGRFDELKEFVDRRTKEFAERYEKRTSVYTDPSKHYSEPRSSSSADHQQRQGRGRPQMKMVNASTSVNSCEFSCTGPEFVKTSSTIESSASRLAAVDKKENSRNSESHRTATSMSFSAPITSSRNQPQQSRRNNPKKGMTAVKSCPESIAYTIVLNPKAVAHAPASVRTESTTTSTTNGSAIDLLYDKVSGPGTDTERMKICETGRFRLEDFLKLNRPDFIEQAEERKEEVETARRRRVQKNQEKENLLMSPHLPRGKISKLLEQSLKGEEEERDCECVSDFFSSCRYPMHKDLIECVGDL